MSTWHRAKIKFHNSHYLEKKMKFNKVTTQTFIAIISFTIVGCDSKDFFQDKKIISSEKISVVCKGDWIQKNHAGLEVAVKTTDSYTFQTSGDELIISINGKPQTFQKNFYQVFEDQPGKPNIYKNWSITQNLIEVIETHKSLANGTNLEESLDDRLKIDRISGKWSHDKSHSRIDKNKKEFENNMYSFGICEKQEQKF